MSATRKSRPAALTFGAVAVAFFFTFANVSCQGQRVASLSGMQLAFGTKIDQSDMWGNKRQNGVRAEPLALFALIAAASGACLALVGPAARHLTALTGGAGAVLLMMLINKMSRDAALHSSGMVEVTPGFGLLMGIVLFFVAGIIAWANRDDRRASISAVPDKVPDMT